VSCVEVNLHAAAPVDVWSMVQQEQCGLSDLHRKLAYAGFPLHSDRLNELAQRLILFGICRPQGDVFRFSVPLPREAIAPLDVRPASTSSAAGRLLLARADLRSLPGFLFGPSQGLSAAPHCPNITQGKSEFAV